MSAVIIPTPGRVVWFYPAPYDGIGRMRADPLAAIVAGVHDDRLVNLAVFDAYGGTQQRTQVRLVQPDDVAPDGGAYAAWMPYQVSQAGIKPAAAQPTGKLAVDGAGVNVAPAIADDGTEGGAAD